MKAIQFCASDATVDVSLHSAGEVTGPAYCTHLY